VSRPELRRTVDPRDSRQRAQPLLHVGDHAVHVDPLGRERGAVRGEHHPGVEPQPVAAADPRVERRVHRPDQRVGEDARRVAA